MTTTRRASSNDIDGILSLQEKYLYRNLDEVERKKGFVTTPFTIPQIEEMRLELLNRFPISITFINKINAVSEKAHTHKLGWDIIDEFEFNDNSYIGLGLDMHVYVLKETEKVSNII